MRDTELLERYVNGGSESAFADLVNRYVNLAYSLALRQVRDRALAEEVVQMTFVLLARKAGSLLEYESLAGWIYRAAYNISLQSLRNERTRREREREAALMQDPTFTGRPEEDSWQTLMPLLDEAVSQLPDADRAALLLRFAQGKAMREVGEALGTTEAAAKMRVGRAVQKVRQFLQKRGATCSSASLAVALARLSSDAAPAGLAASVISAALRSAGSSAAAGSLASILTLMARLKTKLVVAGLGAAAIGFTGNYLFNHALQIVPREEAAGARAASPDETVEAGAPQAPSSFGERWSDKLREFGLDRAATRLRAALHAPPRKGTRSYPSADVESAIAAFGPYHEEAFAILKEAIEGEDTEAALQAISAVGRIGKDVPAARPLLWTLLKSGGSGEYRTSFYALGALGGIGFLPEEIAALTDLIPGQTDQLLVRYVPEQIARAIKRDPEAFKPYLAPVEALLRHEDPAVRFSGACALAELRGGGDPQILRGLAAGLAVSDAYRQRREATGEAVRHLMAVETLERLGPAARPVLPELKAFADQVPDAFMRDLALRTIAAIDTEEAQNNPEIQSILAAEEQRNSLLDRLQAGTWSAADLAEGLKEPRAVSLAASRLGELGPSAKEALPNMHHALAGKDEATRDEILAAMRQIDPSYQVARVPREPVVHGALAAQLELEQRRSQGELDETGAAVEKLIDPFLRGNTSWYTQREVADFTRQLQKAAPRIWNAFLAEASEIDPAFPRTLADPTK